MKKTIRRLVTTAMLIASMVATTMLASASGTMDDYKNGYGSFAGFWSTRTPAEKLKADTETAMGADAYAYFRAGCVLGEDFSTQSRVMEVKLMELDENNDDDHIKTYYVQYINRKFNKVLTTQGESHEKGMMEAEGDEYAELYITYYLEKKSKDSTAPFASYGHFQYYIGMQKK